MINLNSRRAANDAPDIPHTTLSDAELREIGWLINGGPDVQRRMDNLSRRCVEQAQEITRLRNRLTPVSAEAVWSEMTRVFDQEGGLSRDDALIILRKHGAV